MLALLSRIGLSRIRQLFVAKTLSTFSRGANCRRDCDGYRPDPLDEDIESMAICPLREVSNGATAQSHPSEAKAESKLTSTCDARIIRGCLQTLLAGPQALTP